jgi:uncharacterized SAM-dependent methyltransferase
MEVNFRMGETLLTEMCRKFRREGIERIFSGSGFSIDQWFTDPKGWFSLVEVKVKDSSYDRLILVPKYVE